jgi:predicted nuclease of predicted toxin-antitoxin system
MPDLLIAATAELAGLTILYSDKDFELIADLTGQPTKWLELKSQHSQMSMKNRDQRVQFALR